MLASRTLTGPMKVWLFISLLAHLLAAHFSIGFHHLDEHFQILEWVGFKLGITPETGLPWEYASHLRSWLQPASFYGLIQGLKWAGIENPFDWVLGYQILSALLGWLTLVLLCHCALLWFDSPRIQYWAVLTTSMLWFFPFQHARSSGENWGGSFFFLGLSLFFLSQNLKNRLPKNRAFLIGILWGLSFLFRFQMGICIAAGLLWFLKNRVRPFVPILMGILFIVALGVGIDYWGYGEWTFTPWNYFKINILQNKASEFGTEPPWQYLTMIFTAGGPPFSLAFIIFPLLAWIYRREHILTWVSVPFFLIHSIIGHKEMRFLFPIAPALPGLLWLGIQTLNDVSQLKPLKNFFTKWDKPWLHRFLALYNFILMAVACFLPARGELPLYKFLYEKKISPVYSFKDTPYEVFGLQVHFYRFPGMELFREQRPTFLIDRLGDKKPFYLFHPSRSWEFPDSLKEIKSQCIESYTSMPTWARLSLLEPIYKISKVRIVTLYHCTP